MRIHLIIDCEVCCVTVYPPIRVFLEATKFLGESTHDVGSAMDGTNVIIILVEKMRWVIITLLSSYYTSVYNGSTFSTDATTAMKTALSRLCRRGEH